MTGFDNLEISSMAYVPLTTVEQNMEKIGELAAEYIIQSIEEGKCGYMEESVLVKLVVRESCGACAGIE